MWGQGGPWAPWVMLLSPQAACWGAPRSPVPARDAAVAMSRETAHAWQSPGVRSGCTSPHQHGKRQFIPSSAPSRQGFPAGSCAPMPTRSHRLQQTPFPWGHPSPAASRAGACKDCHRLIPPLRATLQDSGGAQGTCGPVQSPIPQWMWDGLPGRPASRLTRAACSCLLPGGDACARSALFW